MLKKSVFKIDDFSGGLATRGSELTISKNQSSDCVNVHSNLFKSLQKRNGYAKVNSSTAGGAANGIFNFRQSDTTQYMVGLWGTALKKMDVVSSAWDGAWDTITQSPTHGTALTSNIMHNSVYDGMLIITTEGRDVPQRYDPTVDANYVDLDWETSHCSANGDTTTPATGTGSYLKITVDGTIFDDIDVRSKTTIAQCVTAINAHTGFAAKGYAYADSSGYLVVISNTRGSTGSINVVDGTSDTGDAQGEATEKLFNGTSITGSTIGSSIAPSGKYCITWQEYTWIANTSTFSDRVHYSNLGQPTVWTSTDYFDILTSGDSGITGIQVLNGRLYIFKQHSIHRVTYLGGRPLLQVLQITEMGTSSPRSIKALEIPGKGAVIMFLGSDQQLYLFDGYNLTPLSEVVYPYNGISTFCMLGDTSTYGINYKQFTKIHAVNYTFRHWYIMFFCKDDDTTPKDAFVYDYYTNSFWPFHFDEDGTDAFTASCAGDNGAGQTRCYVGGSDGAGSPSFYMWLFDSGNSDDGGNIDAHWTSPRLDMGSEVQAKDIRLVQLTSKSVSCTPYYYYRTDWDSSWSSAETLTTATITHVYDIPRFENMYQLKIRDDSTDACFEFYRASIVASASGIDK